ncbi:hypothetical protein [Acidianus sp. HS-5]|uniref:hypothetical protein n=1 Tax=Acidianus sp. HS-5 TaxID=2886040 RepID=UPI001F30D0C6|nr:hypothetical protein [Acidianus sp. HS-5]BDC17466.1 hypothetical protein HS5_03560 [Acidianus sp. HS-5]
MIKKNVLIALLVGLLVAGTAFGLEDLTGYLANLQFSVNSNPAVVYSTNINLGTIYPNESGSYSSTAVINVYHSGVYIIKIVNNSVIQNVFGWFNITIGMQNGTAQMTYHIFDGEYIYCPSNVTVYLNSGSYNVYITVYYTVLPNPEIISYNSPIIAVYYK